MVQMLTSCLTKPTEVSLLCVSFTQSLHVSDNRVLLLEAFRAHVLRTPRALRTAGWLLNRLPESELTFDAVEKFFIQHHLFKFAPLDPLFDCVPVLVLKRPKLWAIAKEHAGLELDAAGSSVVVQAVLRDPGPFQDRARQLIVSCQLAPTKLAFPD